MPSTLPCGCPEDSPERRHEAHLSVGFGDHRRGKNRILLDGLDVTNRTVEVDAVAGYVIAYADPIRLCDTTHARRVLLTGEVQVATRRSRRTQDA